MKIIYGHAVTAKYLGEAKAHNKFQCTFRFKQIFVDIFSVLDSALDKRKILSLTLQMMHLKQFRARFLRFQYPFVGHRT